MLKEFFATIDSSQSAMVFVALLLPLVPSVIVYLLSPIKGKISGTPKWLEGLTFEFTGAAAFYILLALTVFVLPPLLVKGKKTDFTPWTVTGWVKLQGKDVFEGNQLVMAVAPPSEPPGDFGEFTWKNVPVEGDPKTNPLKIKVKKEGYEIAYVWLSPGPPPDPKMPKYDISYDSTNHIISISPMTPIVLETLATASTAPPSTPGTKVTPKPLDGPP